MRTVAAETLCLLAMALSSASPRSGESVLSARRGSGLRHDESEKYRDSGEETHDGDERKDEVGGKEGRKVEGKRER
jgi:hypothetical protein